MFDTKISLGKLYMSKQRYNKLNVQLFKIELFDMEDFV